MVKKKKVLVLGSSGFIGKSIAEGLAKDRAFSIKGISINDFDLTDKSQVVKYLPGLVKDSIVIIAAAITRDRDGSISAMQANINIDSNIASVLLNNPATHVIYISSIDIYGREKLVLPLDESSELNPSNYYGIAKLAGEAIMARVCLEKKIPLAILRLAPVYGPQDTHNSPIKRIILSAIKKEKIRLAGSGQELRDFVYIKDICLLVKKIISKKITSVYNVATSKSCRIKEIVNIIESLCGYKLHICHSDSNKDQDIIFKKHNLLSKKIGISLTDLARGLKETFDYMCAGR